MARESLWYDECLTAQVVRGPNVLKNVIELESSPPLFFLLTSLLPEVRSWPEPSSLRPVSWLAGMLFVLVFLLPVARWVGIGAAVVVALWAAVQPFALWYAMEARPYALLLFLLSVHSVALAMLLRNRRSAWGAGLYIVAGGLAMATHYFAVIPVALGSLALAIARPPRRRAEWGSLALLHLPQAMLALPLAWLMAAQMARGHTSYIPPAPFGDLLRTYLVVMPFGLHAALPAPLRIAGALAIAGLGMIACWRLVQLRACSAEAEVIERRLLGLGLLLWLGSPVILFVVSAALRPIYLYDRYPIMALPGMALLVAWAAGHASARWRRADGIALLAVLAILIGAGAVQAWRYMHPESGTLRPHYRALFPPLVRMTGPRVMTTRPGKNGAELKLSGIEIDSITWGGDLAIGILALDPVLRVPLMQCFLGKPGWRLAQQADVSSAIVWLREDRPLFVLARENELDTLLGQLQDAGREVPEYAARSHDLRLVLMLSPKWQPRPHSTASDPPIR